MLDYSFLILLVIIIIIVYVSSRPIRRSIRDKWQSFATNHGFIYTPHDLNNDFALHGNYQSRDVWIFSRFPRRNKQNRTEVRLTLNEAASNFRFFVSPGMSLLPNITQDKILSGDSELDKRFEFGGQPQMRVERLLQSSIFRSLFKPVDAVPRFDRLTITDNFLEVSGPFYLKEPIQLTNYLVQFFKFAAVLEQELATMPDSSISTNPN